MKGISVLVVEDDPVLREMLELHLRAEGCRVRGTGHGDEVLGLCDEERPDVVVLDVMLPGRTGIELCVAIHERPNPPGVIMVTARGAEADVVLGLDSGADDYVVKPIRPREVVARVRALARRLRIDPEEGAVGRPIRHGKLTIDPASRRVMVDESEVVLTPKEFELLALLTAEPDRVFTRMHILTEIWETQHEGYVRNVDSHVMRLRRKLESAGLDPSVIETKHGTGYRFRPDV